MSDLENIKDLLSKELNLVHLEYEQHIHSQVPLLEEVNSYILLHRGKELRSLLVLLSAAVPSASSLAISPSVIKYAAVVEMLHNASLLHDDVVDQSPLRRGSQSVPYHWNSRLAILCGDYYLAQVMRLLQETDDKEAMRIVNHTVIEMSEGEILQQQYIADAQLDSAVYYEILRRKTASLMQASCQLGNPSMQSFGLHYGMAFQLWDDINDYDEDLAIAKPPVEVLQKEKQKHLAAAFDLITPFPSSKYKDAITSLLEILNS